MLDDNGKRQLKINTVKRNVYILDTAPCASTLALFPNKTQEKYVSLEKKDLPNGYVQELVEKDYPITSESVTSYADGADYRNDPAQAVANAPARVNLGDITEAQKFLDNPQNFIKTFNEVKEKLASYVATIEKSKVKEEEKAGEEDEQQS